MKGPVWRASHAVHTVIQFTRPPAVVLWLCLFLGVSLTPLCCRLPAYRQVCALGAPALDYKAQICLGTHGSELSNKTCGFLPGTLGLSSQGLGKQMEKEDQRRWKI